MIADTFKAQGVNSSKLSELLSFSPVRIFLIQKPGPMYLVWAYHYTLDVNETTGTFMRHASNTRGGMKYTFIHGKYTIVEINDKYRLYWAYDSANEMFYFTVVVQTTGWIAFGVSIQRGGMIGYDVMVGGVDSSGNGYIAVRILVVVIINLVPRVSQLTVTPKKLIYDNSYFYYFNSEFFRII